MKKVLLEIHISKSNEKGVFVGEQILNTLYNSIEQPSFLDRLFGKKTPNFTFEIVSKNNKIYFYISCRKEYKKIVTNQIYAHFPTAEIVEIDSYLDDADFSYCTDIVLKNPGKSKIKTYTQFSEKTEKDNIDPLSSLTSGLSKYPDAIQFIQVHFAPTKDKNNKNVYGWFQVHSPIVLILTLILLSPIKFGLFLLQKTQASSEETETKTPTEETTGFLFKTHIICGISWVDAITAKSALRESIGSFNIFSVPKKTGFGGKKMKKTQNNKIKARLAQHGFTLGADELAGMVHFPNKQVKTPGIEWIQSKSYEPPNNLPIKEVSPFAKTKFRDKQVPFGILPDDRRRHIYVVGKTGMGKSTLLQNMVIDDIANGEGVAVIDPHGDLIESILEKIPKGRTNDVIVFNPFDIDHPIGFNMLENVSAAHRPMIASGLIGIFKKMFENSWGPRLEYILRNTILTLLEIPGANLMYIPAMLTDKKFREKNIAKVTDWVLKNFWEKEFAKMNDRQLTEAASPILNKIGQFLSNPVIRHIVGQSKNTFSFRWAMDKKKIILVNLSKGKIGEDTSHMLGSMIITKFQIDAMSRADIAEKDRTDYYLYVDEFQNFATESFATILSEARKYKLSLIIANQYIAQMTDVVRDAVFGNVGTTISFQVWYADAEILEKIFGGEEVIGSEDVMQLKKYDVYINLLINGMPSGVFSATTLPPTATDDPEAYQNKEKIINVSRSRYASNIEKVQEKIKAFHAETEAPEKKYPKKTKKNK